MISNPNVSSAFLPSFFDRNRRFSWAAVAFLLIVGAVLRLMNVTNPPLDFHPTRQLRSAIIARSLYYQISPKADPAQRQLAVEMKNSLEVYEPPIFEGLVALTYAIIGKEILWVSRLYEIVFWSLAGLALFGVARRLISDDGAIFSLAYFLILEFGVIASRSFQPDPLMVMWILLVLYALLRWVDKHSWKWALLTGCFAGVAILVKTVAIFFVGVTLVIVLLAFWGLKRTLINKQTWVVAALTALIPATYYLFLIGGRSAGFFEFWTVGFAHLLLRPGFYVRWFSFIRGLVSWQAIFLALIGTLLFPGKTKSFPIGLWLGYVFYGMMFPYQIYTHEYYSLVLIPIVSLCLAPLAALIISPFIKQSRVLQLIMIGIAIAVITYNVWLTRGLLYSEDYRPESTGWIKMGQSLPKDGAIIALTHDYGNRIRYYGWVNVSLWPYVADFNLNALRSGNGDIDFDAYFSQATAGRRYFLVTQMSELEAQPELKSMLYDHYVLTAQGDGYVLFDLLQPK